MSIKIDGYLYINRKNITNIKKTTPQFIYDLGNKNPPIRVRGDYINAKTNIEVECLLCEHVWFARPINLLSGKGCPSCKAQKISKSKRKSHENFKEQLHGLNPNIVPISQYKGTHDAMQFNCLICDNSWKMCPNDILRDPRCRICNGNGERNEVQFLKEVYEIHPNIEVLTPYINTHSELQVKCKLDGYIWTTNGSKLLRGTGCARCAGNEKLTTKSFKDKIAINNPHVEVLGEYINSQSRILVRCKVCKHEWMPIATQVLNSSGCPKCRFSKGEIRVSKTLEKLQVVNIPQEPLECKDKIPMPFDFYLPNHRACIEYQGEQHFVPVDYSGKGEKRAKQKLEYTQHHDQIKRNYCKANGILLLEIPYWEFNNIEQIITDFIQSIENNRSEKGG